MTTGISSINNIVDLKAYFFERDRNYDYHISIEEDKNLVDNYDKDKNNSVELWELMEAVNRQRQSEIFPKEEIAKHKDILKYLENQHIEEKTRIGSLGHQLVLLEYLAELGLPFDETEALAKSFKGGGFFEAYLGIMHDLKLNGVPKDISQKIADAFGATPERDDFAIAFEFVSIRRLSKKIKPGNADRMLKFIKWARETFKFAALLIFNKISHYKEAELAFLLDTFNKIGSSAIDVPLHKIETDISSEVFQHGIKTLDIDGQKGPLSLDDNIKHVTVKRMEAYAFRRRGIAVKVNPKFRKTHQVIVYNKELLMGIFPIPESGNVNQIRAYFPADIHYCLQVYLVKKTEVKDFAAERARNKKIRADGALFISINNFYFIETKPENLLMYAYKQNRYDPQYFFDEEYLLSEGEKKAIEAKSGSFDQARLGDAGKRVISSLTGNPVEIDANEIKETPKSIYLTGVLLRGLEKQMALNQKLQRDPRLNEKIQAFIDFLNGDAEAVSRLLFGKDAFMGIFNNLVSEIMLEEQRLAEQPENTETLNRVNWLTMLLSFVPNLEQFIDHYYAPGNSEKMLAAAFFNLLYPGVFPANLFSNHVPVVENAFFEPAQSNSNGSFDLIYHFKESGKEEQVVIWKNVFPGTIIVRPLTGAAFAASSYPGNYEHGIMFAGVNSAGIPMAISHPSGYSELSMQIAGKRPEKVKFVQVERDTDRMKDLGQKAVRAARYLMGKNPEFKMNDPGLPFTESNRVRDDGSEFGYYYRAMYCFMMIAKAYELAGYDLDKINRYNLDYNRLLAFTKEKGILNQTSALMRLTGSASIGKQEKGGWLGVVRRMTALFGKSDFPGIKDIPAFTKWLETQAYEDKMLLIKFFYYTGEEFVEGEDVKIIEPEIKTPVSK